MSVDEVEPIEAEAADENAVAPRGTHLASTQTVTHEYLTQSGKVMRETVKTDGTVTLVLDFIYDESGKPFAMIDQLGALPKTYYYVLNLQGDVVKLVTESGAVAASYEYDAWGNILSSSGSKAEINPLRYRGYYYDTETGFYYLQSRYYDPVTHRFINADSYSSTGQGIIGYNMFAYCNNSPVIQADHTGEFGLLTLVSAVVSAAVNVATTYIAAKATGQEYTLTDALVSAAIGAVNAIPGAGPFIAGGISGAYSAYTAVKNGATAGEAALCFAVSATATTASIGNLANLGTESALRIAATASADLVFGTGYNCIAATTNKAVSVKAEERKASGTQTTSTTRSRNTQKRGNKRTGYTMCLY
jgi:RHS repeat-associated protein